MSAGILDRTWIGGLGVNWLVGSIMAETNGGRRLDDHEQRLGRLEAARREMEDTLVVMAHLESKSAARMKEHAEFLVAMDKRHELKMAEFDDKLNALIDMIGRQQGGIESRS
jgi:hypothetical protein